jgi:NAD(P)H dehydrogenase (quinone)
VLVFISSDGPVAQVMVHHHNVIRAARASRVAHVVALSGLDADPSSPFCYAVSYGYTERLLAECGCAVSIARASASGRHHDITGPESLDLAAIAALAARQWGTALEYVAITAAEHSVEMAIAGEDPWWMYAYSTMFASIREQRWAAVSDEVHGLAGCLPVPVRKTLAGYRHASLR